MDEPDQAANPTGGTHTPTPWHKGQGEHSIMTETGTPIAWFRREEDRDLALYFTNVHASVISLLRNAAQNFESIAQASVDSGLCSYARESAAALSAYADVFCRLEKIEEIKGEFNAAT
jgi:hypothetical protein